jgi:hypothetical protein
MNGRAGAPAGLAGTCPRAAEAVRATDMVRDRQQPIVDATSSAVAAQQCVAFG